MIPTVVEPPGPLLGRLERSVHGTILPPEEQREYLSSITATLPKQETAGDAIAMLAVSSLQRRSYLFVTEGQAVVVDDQLRRKTFASLDSFASMHDRPLVAWTYFGLIYAEILSSSGYRNTLQLARCLLPIVVGEFWRHLDSRGFIPRPALMEESVSLQQSGLTGPEEAASYKAASCFSTFHEFGHWAHHTEAEGVSKACEEIRDLIEEALPNATLGQPAYQYWVAPAIHDPRYGGARLPGKDADALRRVLRDELIEELFCDWYATSLILSSSAFSELSVSDVLTIVTRHLSWNQLLQDARSELKQIATVRKRWRSHVIDASCVRQNMLLPLLVRRELAGPILGPQAAQALTERLAGFEVSEWQNVVERATVRRQYLRFLAFGYPAQEDRHLAGIQQVVASLRGPPAEALDGDGVVVWHQPAEWGAGDPHRLVHDLKSLVIASRLGEETTSSDDEVDELTPFVREGYSLLWRLRQVYWAVSNGGELEEDKIVEWRGASFEEVLKEIGRAVMLVRLSHSKWLEKQLEEAIENSGR